MTAANGHDEAVTGRGDGLPGREAWLMALTHHLRVDFAAHGATVPLRLRVACGWTAGSKERVLGQCWTPTLSADGTTEIFISPRLSDPISVGSVLVHELIHATVGIEHGHRGAFKQLATRLDLQGPMRSTTAGAVLKARLNALAEQLGPYPHAALGGELLLSHGTGARQAPLPRPDGRPRIKQNTRLHKVICGACGYTVRVTKRWMDAGLPQCPCGTRMAWAGPDPVTNTPDAAAGREP